MKTRIMSQAALIAAIYVAVTYFVNAWGLANGAIQVRLSEAMCILPIFTPAAIPGLFLGCFLSNILNGCVIWDIIFGSIATLIGALGTYKLKHTRFLFTLPPVISNAIIIPFVLKYAYGVGDAIWFMVITVGIGEIISVCGIGMILKRALEAHRHAIFEGAGA